MKPTSLFTLAFISFFLITCNNKEELYEVEIPEKHLIIEDENTASPKNVVAKEGTFKMRGLNYEYADLEPHLDAKTVEIHYSKHHLAYLEKLNEIVKGTELQNYTIEDILTSIDPENKALINNAGGYYNHNLYWDILEKNKTENPSGRIIDLINRDFGSLDSFKTQFKKAANNILGSGWVWLILTDNQNLKITTTTNQNNPLMPFETEKGFPLMNLDMWEHAYYLKYKNNKNDYIDNYFKLINWEKISNRIELSKNLENSED